VVAVLSVGRHQIGDRFRQSWGGALDSVDKYLVTVRIPVEVECIGG